MSSEFSTFWSEIQVSLNPEDKVLITPHVSVDGDALGSSLALCLALEKMGYQCEIWIDEAVPDFYKFLPDIDRVKVYSHEEKIAGDALFMLDCHGKERLGKREFVWDCIDNHFILDHHQYETPPVDAISLIDSERSSTCEMVFELIQAMEDESSQQLLDEDIAYLMTCGIYTDTGGLRFSNTGVRTYEIMAKLREFNVPIDLISERVFSSLSREEFRARGLALMKARFELDGRLAWCFFLRREILATGVKDDELGAMSSLMRDVNGVDLSLFMREEVADSGNSIMHVSIRSTENCDSSELGRRLGGGGHLRAAGATVRIEDDPYITVENILKEARQLLLES